MENVYLRRKLKVVLPPSEGATPINIVASLQRNLESLGFLFDQEVIDGLTRLSPIQVEQFGEKVIEQLKSMVGSHRQYQPFYPNFPKQVMQMSEVALYFNAIMHYMTLLRPGYEAKPRPALDEDVKYRIIRLGNQADMDSIVSSLAKSTTSFSKADQEDLITAFLHYQQSIAELMPANIPNKENLAFLGAQMIWCLEDPFALLDKYIKNVTDVLRLAVALSNGDLSLAEPCKFGKLRRCERRWFLQWIDRADNRVEDMLRWKSRWIRLGERLHPGEYADQYPRAAAAFSAVRNGERVVTFLGAVETAFLKQDPLRILSLLSTRPGLFARRLDHLVRSVEEPQPVVDSFAEVADKVSTPVLIQAHAHFGRRDEPASMRAFFPKGQVAKLYALREALPTLRKGVAEKLAGVCETALIERFAKLPPLGSCYIDPKLKTCLAPFAIRSASKSLRTLVRGSRLPLPKCKTLRFFIWWKNGVRRTDLDLSAVMYDEHFQYQDTLAYYNLKNFAAHHSGDIVDAPNGASEFIDISLLSCIRRSVRYVAMCVNSFTRQPYCDLPECFAGWMARKKPNSGEVYEPKTVVDKVDLASDSRLCIPAIFDLVKQEVIWADVSYRINPRFNNNVHNNLSGVSLMIKGMTELRKPDLYTLFRLHATARGELTDSRERADTIFAMHEGVTPFDLDTIRSEYMG